MSVGSQGKIIIIIRAATPSFPALKSRYECDWVSLMNDPPPASCNIRDFYQDNHLEVTRKNSNTKTENRFWTLEAWRQSKHCFSEINQTSNVARDDRQDVVWFVYILICPEGSLGPQQKPKLIKQIFILDCFVVMEAVLYLLPFWQGQHRSDWDFTLWTVDSYPSYGVRGGEGRQDEVIKW